MESGYISLFGGIGGGGPGGGPGKKNSILLFLSMALMTVVFKRKI